MNQFIFKLADRIYQYIFGYPMGERARKFFKNLGILTLGSVIASALSFGAMILAGRIMGPLEYGKANIVFSISNFLVIPTVLGTSMAVTRYLAKDQEKTERGKMISTSLYLTIGMSLLLFVVFLFIKDHAARSFRIGSPILYFSLVYTVILIFYNLVQAIFRGFHQFKRVSLFNIISSIVFVGSLAVFLFFDRSFKALVLSSTLRWGIMLCIALLLLKEFLGKFDFKSASRIMRYGFLVSFSMMPIIVLTNIDRLVLNFFLGERVVGIYSAYFLAPNLIANKGLEAFSIVFFPFAIIASDKKVVFLKLNKLFLYGAPFVISLFFVLIFITLLFFSREYPVNVSVMLLISVSSFCYLLTSILSLLIVSRDGESLQFAFRHALASVVINVVLLSIMIPLWKIPGALFAGILSFAYLILVYEFYFYRLCKN